MRTSQWFILAVVAGIFAGPPSVVHAQQPSREVALDVRPFSADVSIAWERSPGHLWGFLVGGGPEEFSTTFVPEVDATDSESVTLEQMVRLGPFYRFESGERLGVDVGASVSRSAVCVERAGH